MQHDPHLAECLYDRTAIDALMDQQETRLNARYAQSRPLVLCVMTGALVYAGHLLHV